MACLVDLSKKLKIRAELLRQQLHESGLGKFNLEDELPEDIHDYLLDSHKQSRWKSLSQGLREKIGSLWACLPRRRSKPGFEAGLPPVEVAPVGVAPVEVPQALSGEVPQPSIVESQPHTPDAFTQELLQGVEQSFPLGELTDEILIEEITAPLPLKGHPLQAPRVPLAEKENIDSSIEPSLIIESLAEIEKIQEILPPSPPPIDPLMEVFEPFEEPSVQIEPVEPPDEIDSVLEDSVIPGHPAIPLLFEEKEKVSSIDIQNLVDKLAQEVPDLEKVEVIPQVHFLSRLSGMVPRIHLNTREKLVLAAALALTSAIIAGAFFFRGVNYGPGGDERFYKEGVARQKDKQYDYAIKSFEKVIDRYPASPLVLESYNRIADSYEKKDETEMAIKATRQSLAVHSRRVGKATSEWTQEQQEYRWKALLRLGNLFAARNEWESSADSFRQVIEENSPPSIKQRASYQLADILFRLEGEEGKDPIVIRNLIKIHEEALSASPESEWTSITLSRVAQLWEDLAVFELGIRQEDLQKALDYMQKLEHRSSTLASSGIDPLDVQLRMARINRELGQIEESIGIYRNLLAVPKDPLDEKPPPFKVVSGLAHSLLARAEVRAGEAKSASAESDLYEVLELTRHPEDSPFNEDELSEALYLKGHAYYQLGVLKAVQEGDVSGPFFEKMDTAYQSALSRNDNFGPHGEDSLLALMRRTNYLFQVNHDYRDAVRSFKRILEQFPANIYSYRVRHRLATALFQLGEYEEAERYFQQVVDQFGQTRYVDDQAFRDSFFRLGHCQFLLKNFGHAADTIKTLLQLVDYEKIPEVLSAWRLLAESYYSQGLYDQAVAEYRNFLARYPDEDVEGKIRLALGRTLIARFDYDKGRQELEEVVRTDPFSQSARLARYFICESYLAEYNLAPDETRNSLLQKALSDAEVLRASYPSEDSPLHLLGRIHFLMGDYERAARDLEYFCNATQGQQPPASVRLMLGEAYFNLRQYKKATGHLAQLNLNELPREEAARALYFLAESQRYDNLFQEAAATYTRLTKDFPTSPYSEVAQGRIEEVLWRMKKGI